MINFFTSLINSNHPITKVFLEGKTKGLKLSAFLSRSCDALLKGIVNEKISASMRGEISLVATGGYGRSEIFLMSDLDILFLVSSPSQIPEDEIRKIIYPLWDKRIDLGYSVRTIRESLELSLKDMKVFTSLLDARMITGSRELFQSFKREFIRDVIVNRGEEFVDEMIGMREARKRRAGDSIFVLEPELKEGQGGLRDYHTSLWLAKVKFGANKFEELLGRGFLRQSTLRDLFDALNFIFDLRHRLHLKWGNRTDRFSFEMQERIAKEKRYRSDKNMTDVEKLMRCLYEACGTIDSFCDLITEKTRSIHKVLTSKSEDKPKRITPLFGRTAGEIITYSGKNFLKKPVNIMKAFTISKKCKLGLHEYLKELIFDYFKARKKINWEEEAYSLFREMFKSGKGLYETLNQMHKLGVVESLIPELRRIKGRVQHDIYHAYTVDAHSLIAIRELCRLEAQEFGKSFSFLSSLMDELQPKDKKVLYISALLHDIGKGRGKDHSIVGKKIACGVCKRLFLSEVDSLTISFLVANHLLMSKVAQRRNIDDPVMLNKFINQVQNTKNLKLLYLLTFADLRSVSQNGEAFTPWKNLLLYGLYEKSLELFSLGTYRRWVFGKKVKAFKVQMVARLKGKDQKKELRRFLDSLPESYFRSFNEEEIEKHFKMVQGLNSKSFVTDNLLVEDYNVNKVTVCTRDFPGLFSALAGAFSASRINILSTLVFSTDDGYALDAFVTQGMDGKGISLVDSRWEEFERLLDLALRSREDFRNFVKRRLGKSKSILDGNLPKVKTEIRFDNSGSEDFSIVEVYAEDRLGLLYDIASVLSEVAVDIHFAKISTEGNRAQDIFYLTDLNGKKLRKEAQISLIREKIEKTVEL